MNGRLVDGAADGAPTRARNINQFHIPSTHARAHVARSDGERGSCCCLLLLLPAAAAASLSRRAVEDAATARQRKRRHLSVRICSVIRGGEREAKTIECAGPARLMSELSQPGWKTVGIAIAIACERRSYLHTRQSQRIQGA
jgi:hypothetical protein